MKPALEQIKILFLLFAGLGFSVTSLGWTQKVHVECCTHEHDHDHEGHDHEQHHDEEHDETSCVICQHLATLSKQALLTSTPLGEFNHVEYLCQDPIPATPFGSPPQGTAAPRAPPTVI